MMETIFEKNGMTVKVTLTALNTKGCAYATIMNVAKITEKVSAIKIESGYAFYFLKGGKLNQHFNAAGMKTESAKVIYDEQERLMNARYFDKQDNQMDA